MTPDTSTYMIAGFSVILAGISFYVISLIVRNSRVKHQLDLIEHDDADRP